MDQIEEPNSAGSSASAAYAIEQVYSVTQSASAGTYFVDFDYTGPSGTERLTAQAVNETDPYGVNPTLWQWLMDHEGGFTVQPYVPPQPTPYQISKTTPWLRMTDEEAELITGAMQQANARQKAIYDAASYLSSGDPLWSTLHDMIASTLGSTSRADQLLAPET